MIALFQNELYFTNPWYLYFVHTQVIIIIHFFSVGSTFLLSATIGLGVVSMLLFTCFYFYCAYFYFYFCFASNLLNAYYTISSLNPFFLKNILFYTVGILSIFSPPKKNTATPIFFSFYSSFFSYSYYFFFCFASEFPILFSKHFSIVVQFL